MDWLNFHHLRYFWTTARERSVTRAAEKLHISQPTVSAQIRELEGALGEKLFARAGRDLTLTDTGRLVYRYAEEIFGLGQELLDAVKDRPTARPLRVQVGVTDSLQKLVAYRLLEPALKMETTVQMTCREGRPDELLAELATHALDVVLSDDSAAPSLKVRAFSHLLGESSVAVYGAPKILAAHRGRLPRAGMSLMSSVVVAPGRPAQRGRRQERHSGPAHGRSTSRNKGSGRVTCRQPVRLRSWAASA